MQDVNYQLFADSVEAECSLGMNLEELEDVRNVLEELGLWKYKDRHPNTLSGGQKQRLAVAVGMMHKKDIILFDEPTSGLDYVNMDRMSGLIKKLAVRGKIIIIATHDGEFITKCCTDVMRS